MKRTLLPLLLAALATSCASTGETDPGERADRGVIVTGSHVPKRVRPGEVSEVSTASKEEYERGMDSAFTRPRPKIGSPDGM